MAARLHTLPIRTPARIALVDDAPRADIAHRLREMGFDEGVEVEVLYKAPLGGDPVAVRVGGATICLRRVQARQIALDLPLAAE